MQAAPAPATDTETPDPRRAFPFFCSPPARRKGETLAGLYEVTRLPVQRDSFFYETNRKAFLICATSCRFCGRTASLAQQRGRLRGSGI